MKVTNIKKIVIWALVVVNLFFLALFLWGIYKDQARKTETLQNLCSQLKQNGIDISVGNIHEGNELAELETSRDSAGEQSLADALLGKTEKTDQGGIIYTYTAENKGQAVFYSGGKFDMTFSSGVYKITTNAENETKSLLKMMNIETISTETSGTSGNETVTAVSSWKNQPIFNCRIKFIFKDGSLAAISGKRAAIMKATSDKTDMSSSATALLHFLKAVKDGKFSCTQITSVDPGYFFTSGDNIFTVWRIDTNTGVYYVEALTGTVDQDT